PTETCTLSLHDALPILAGDGELPDQPQHVGALLVGRVRPPTWRDPEPAQADFFAAKGILSALLDGLRVEWAVAAAPEPFLHPGRSEEHTSELQSLAYLV